MRGLHCLYRHYDAEGALLYIGISSSLAHRIEAHRRASDWFPLVASISVQHFDTREALEEAERAAIVAEKPPPACSQLTLMDIGQRIGRRRDDARSHYQARSAARLRVSDRAA